MPNACRYFGCFVLSVYSVFFLPSSLFGQSEQGKGLRLERTGTEQVYFSYNGKPLLSFGALCDFIFYLRESEHDFRLWADWASDHGMNHIRAYPPLCWTLLQDQIRQNGGKADNIDLPYAEVSSGSRQFDLTRFNENWWKDFRTKCEYLRSKGIILHLLMWSSFHVRPNQWKGSLFNPDNNISSFTNHLKAKPFKIHSLLDEHEELTEVQRDWFRKLIEQTYDLDNVYYDLVHEIEPRYDNWEDTKLWIQDMASAVRQKWYQLDAKRPLILGMDAGKMDGMGYPRDQHAGMPPEGSAIDWMFTRPYFDVLIYGRSHFVENAIRWRRKYKKPYIGQECFDDNGQTYTYRRPTDRVHIRKYVWKFMMAKCQQMDIYMKGGSARPGGPPGFNLNYDPRGWSPFEKDAVILRRFWESLIDCPNLWFTGAIETGPGNHQYVLSSPREAVIYCSSATGIEGQRFEKQTVRARGLAIRPGDCIVEIIKPDAGLLESRRIELSGSSVEIELPEFVDDIAVHLIKQSN